MAFRDGLLQESGFETDATGFRVRLGLPRYRSMPLSCVSLQELSVDGQAVAHSDTVLRLDDREYSLAELPKLHDVWWFMPDRAELRVRRPGGLSPGDHDIEVALGLRIPYVLVQGQSEFPVEITRTRKWLTCVPARTTEAGV